MFAATTKAVVDCLGAWHDLVPNRNVNFSIDLLTLVKVHNKPFRTTYFICNKTLLHLLEEANFSPEYTENVLVDDFTTIKYIHAEGSAEANIKTAGGVSAELSAGLDSVDATSPFNLKKKTVDTEKLTERCNDKKIKKKLMEELELKKRQRLTFVHEIVYNSSPVKLLGTNQQAASVSAAVQTFFKTKILGKTKKTTSFTLPENTTFAYSLIDIKTDDGVLRILPKHMQFRAINRVNGNGKKEILEQVNKALKRKFRIVKKLVHIPERSRFDLLNNLRDILRDRHNLTLLIETWGVDCPGESECPLPVSSFKKLLKTIIRPKKVNYMLYLLISAMDALPDDLPALLTCCRPDTLRVLNQLVDGLKDNAQTKLPESLPPPLQEDGELRWVLELLCSSGETLTELSDEWHQPELSLAELLEALGIVIRALSLIQPEEES